MGNMCSCSGFPKAHKIIGPESQRGGEMLWLRRRPAASQAGKKSAKGAAGSVRARGSPKAEETIRRK